MQLGCKRLIRKINPLYASRSLQFGRGLLLQWGKFGFLFKYLFSFINDRALELYTQGLQAEEFHVLANSENWHLLNPLSQRQLNPHFCANQGQKEKEMEDGRGDGVEYWICGEDPFFVFCQEAIITPMGQAKVKTENTFPLTSKYIPPVHRSSIIHCISSLITLLYVTLSV